MKAFSFIQGLFVTSALVSSTGAGSTGNSLVTCAACQVSEAQFGPWNCQVNCDVVSSENDITVSSTLIRELMNKVDQLNKTVVELQENNTALADKSTALADKVNKIEDSRCAFAAQGSAGPHKMANSSLIVFENVDLNTCNGYNGSTGIFSATKAGTYIFTTHALAVVNRGYFRMKKNDDVICGAWVHGDWGDVTCSTVTHLDLGDEVKVTGDDYGPAEILCGHSGFSGILIYPD